VLTSHAVSAYDEAHVREALKKLLEENYGLKAEVLAPLIGAERGVEAVADWAESVPVRGNETAVSDGSLVRG
jgi:hypothetical protein